MGLTMQCKKKPSDAHHLREINKKLDRNTQRILGETEAALNSKINNTKNDQTTQVQKKEEKPQMQYTNASLQDGMQKDIDTDENWIAEAIREVEQQQEQME